MRYQPWVSLGKSANEIAGQQRKYEQRAAEMRARKLARGCDLCGYAEHPSALEWDHRPDEIKLFTIATFAMRRPELVDAELAKCDLLCANCHRVRTAERRHYSNGWSKNTSKTQPHPQLWEESA